VHCGRNGRYEAVTSSSWRGGWGPSLAGGLIAGAVIDGIASSAYAYGPGYGYYGGPGYGFYGGPGYGYYGYAPAYYGGYAPAYYNYGYAPAYYGGYSSSYYAPCSPRILVIARGDAEVRTTKGRRDGCGLFCSDLGLVMTRRE
jgi:hypothetical protein